MISAEILEGIIFMSKIMVIISVSVLALLFLSWLISQLIKLKKLKECNTLESCFGEPLHSDMFTFSDVKQWVKKREDKLKNDCKAVVLKVNHDTLRELGKDIDLKTDQKNYIVVAIINRQKSIDDSVLVQYNRLDDSLENILDKGDGVLVIGG